MVKVCFIGISLRLEHAAIERLRSELDVLAQQEPEIEFWFHGFHSDFIKSMLDAFCGGQRQLSAANGSLVLDSRSGFNHHSIVLGCTLQDSVGGDLVIQNHGAPACRFPLRADTGAEIMGI